MIFEISIGTTSIGNFCSGSCSPSPNLHSKARQAGDFHTDSDTVLGFFQILVRQLSREETIEAIETTGAMVSSETIWNEVQVARTAGWVFHPILKMRLCAHANIAWLCNFFFIIMRKCAAPDAILVCSLNKDYILNGTL